MALEASLPTDLASYKGLAPGLQPTDVIVVEYAYEVTASETVLPDQMSSLQIQAGEDLCTLVTCTPYGVNSHRLLVHAKRVGYEPQVVETAPAHVSSRNVPLYAAFALIFGTILVVLVFRRMRTRGERR